jgi:dihydrofolate reductase
VDGYVAGVDGSVAWLDEFQAQSYGYDHFIQGIDAIVIGRTTFEQVLAFGRWPYAGKQVFVLTSRPLPSPPPRTTIWQASPAELATHIGGASFRGDVWVLGGPRTIQAFGAIDAVDSYEICVLPVLLGQGIPLFGRDHASTRLRLADHHVFADGAVELVYEPARTSSETAP